MKTPIRLINELRANIKHQYPTLSIYMDFDDSKGIDAFYPKPNDPYIILYPNASLSKGKWDLVLITFAHEYGHYLSFRSKNRYDKKDFRIAYVNYASGVLSIKNALIILQEEIIAWIYGFDAILNLKGNISFPMIFLCIRCLYGYLLDIFNLLLIKYIVQYFLLMFLLVFISFYHILT